MKKFAVPLLALVLCCTLLLAPTVKTYACPPSRTSVTYAMPTPFALPLTYAAPVSFQAVSYAMPAQAVSYAAPAAAPCETCNTAVATASVPVALPTAYAPVAAPVALPVPLLVQTPTYSTGYSCNTTTTVALASHHHVALAERRVFLARPRAESRVTRTKTKTVERSR